MNWSLNCGNGRKAQHLTVAIPSKVAHSTRSVPDPLLTVAQLLEQSRARQRLRATMANNGSASQPRPDYVAATAAAQLALDARLEAHTLDPDHTDPAWLLDKTSHDSIVTFLQDYIVTL